MNEDEYNSYGYIPFCSRIINPSTIVSLAAAVFLVLGLTAPIIDFSAFHKEVDIQYNFMKVCENIGIISPIWIGIPYGIIVGIVLLVILSFANIPLLKLIPAVLILVMYAIALFDIGNIVDWVNKIIEKFLPDAEMVVDAPMIFDGIMRGAYFTVIGILLMIVSMFIKGAKIKPLDQA